jgi:hypothetical protein
MKDCLLFVVTVLLMAEWATAGEGKSHANPQKLPGEPDTPSVREVLRAARDLALKQDKHQRYWTQTVLLQIADLQIRTGDFDDALQAIRASSDTYRRDHSPHQARISRIGSPPYAIGTGRPARSGTVVARSMPRQW